jgi:hypothetical protein
MRIEASTVAEYLEKLPDDRRAALQAVRKIIRQNLDGGFKEGIQYGMIGYFVPHNVYPPGYHCDPKQPLPFAGLASQKNYMSMYLGCIYVDTEREAWFRKEWSKTGKRLDMGKACIRFKKLDDLPLELIAEVIAKTTAKDYIEFYESVIKAPRTSPARKAKQARKKAVVKKPASTSIAKTTRKKVEK